MSAALRIRLVGVIGGLGLAILALAVATSYSTVPDFSLWRRFISELGHPQNPSAWRLNRGFMVGGALTGAALLCLATLVRRSLRVAAALGASAGICIALVGAYPLHRGMAHVVPALVAVLTSISASVVLSIVARRARALSRRQIGLVIALSGLQIIAIIGGAICAVVLIKRGQLDPNHLFYSRAVQLENPLFDGSTLNPIAISEWLFFVSSWLLLCGAVFVGPRVLRRR